MLSVVSSLLAGLSLALKQPLAGYCDVETAHGDALVTKTGDYCHVGARRRHAAHGRRARTSRGSPTAMRLDLSGALEARGHAIVGWYISDPDVAERRDRAAQPGLLPPRRARGRPRPHRHSRRARTLWPQLDALGGGLLRPLDAPRGADQGRSASS